MNNNEAEKLFCVVKSDERLKKTFRDSSDNDVILVETTPKIAAVVAVVKNSNVGGGGAGAPPKNQKPAPSSSSANKPAVQQQQRMCDCFFNCFTRVFHLCLCGCAMVLALLFTSDTSDTFDTTCWHFFNGFLTAWSLWW